MPNVGPPRSPDRPYRELWVAVCAGAALALSVLSALTVAQTPPTAAFREPAWSPDGRRLAIIVADRLWTVRPDGSQERPLTTVPGNEREPAWSPDGRRIAFASDRGGEGFDLYTVAADG